MFMILITIILLALAVHFKLVAIRNADRLIKDKKKHR